ncbi:MAG TPA: HK97 family phage prohead protease [Acetobacteraceae bacterium]|nr:HK97 family phage prohead protease [Acetobacteraceae bacterium]
MTQYRAFLTRTTALADLRQVKVICSTPAVGRDKIKIPPGAFVLDNYRRNPLWLWQHNPDWPVARSVTINENEQGRLGALVQFPPIGASDRSDEIYNLIAAGVINAASTGFEVLASEPIDPNDLSAGISYTRVELQEMSFVSIPAEPNSLVEERSRREHGNPSEGWKCGAAGDLPIDETRPWDADAARERVFRWAGYDGKNPDPVKARRAFLCYDASDPSLRGSFKLPFADILEGRLTAIRRGLDAAAAMLERTDIPEREKERARQVIQGYQAKEPTGPERAHRRMATLYRRELAGGGHPDRMERHRRMAALYRAEIGS